MLLALLPVMVFPHTGLAARLISIDLGYVGTSSENYGSGLTYGLAITEGKGKIGFGIVAQRFSNSVFYDRPIESGTGTRIFKYEEALSDFYLTIMATYNRRFGVNTTTLLAGLGPQVHFITGTKYYITDGYSLTARDFRLGVGLLLRYEQRFYAFGNLTFVLTGQYSWAEAGRDVDPLQGYGPAPESLSLPAVTAGLAFPF
ncbi:MAG: hypothetical protein ABIJ00_13885 [Candidatus Eisenbacteria bacterium]